LGAGRPTLISAVGAFAELPDDVCAKVDTDWSEMSLILAYTRLFQNQPHIAAQLGRNARAFVAREHSLQQAAEGYVRFLSELYGWGDTATVRDVLWNVEEPRTKYRELRTENRELGIRTSATVLDEVVGEVAHATAELGLHEEDAQPLQNIATTLHDLFSEPTTQRRRREAS
jgi:hypothetical protein